MKIYKDVLSGDKMFDDSFNMKLVDDSFYEVETINTPVAGDQGTVYINNLVKVYNLQVISVAKHDVSSLLDRYTKRLNDHLQQNDSGNQVDVNEKTKSLKERVVSNFDDYVFYTGASMDPAAMIVLFSTREDKTPIFTFWKHGLVEVEA